MISVVILTLNEGVNLERCLNSVVWADEILVMDSGSTDVTLDIARAAGARILIRPFDSFALQRNHAMENGNLRNAWVLHLDADETVPEALQEELQGISRQDTSRFPVYRVASRLIFMGGWLRHAGMYPAYQVRFGRRDSLRFVDYGHGQREAQAPAEIGTLRTPLDHYNFSKGVNEWYSRHLRYARTEALQSLEERKGSSSWGQAFSRDATTRRRALKRIAYRSPCRPLLRFLYVYFLKRGFLDGKAGWHYAAMMGTYQHFIDLNELELLEKAKGKGKSHGTSVPS